LFSCYAPLLRKFTKAAFNNNEENLPNLVDYSPEELRWEAISSNMKGQFHDYTTKLQLLSQSYHTIQRALQNLDQATSNFIVNILKIFLSYFLVKTYFLLFRSNMNVGKMLVQQAQL
jgi:hypothetical protein